MYRRQYWKALSSLGLVSLAGCLGTAETDDSDGSPPRTSDTGSVDESPTDGKPVFDIVEVTHPSSIRAGETATFQIQVENTGTASGTTDIELLIGTRHDMVERSESLTVSPTATETVSFTVDLGTQRGQYEYQVTDSATGVSQLGEIEITDPEFTFRDLTLDRTVDEGESIPVRVVVENTGTATGTATVSLAVETIERSEQITLAAGDSTLVEFTIEPVLAAGTYTVLLGIESEYGGQVDSTQLTVTGEADDDDDKAVHGEVTTDDCTTILTHEFTEVTDHRQWGIQGQARNESDEQDTVQINVWFYDEDGVQLDHRRFSTAVRPNTAFTFQLQYRGNQPADAVASYHVGAHTMACPS